MITECVTIVLPSYNRRELTRKSLASIFSQNWPENQLEVILVDDGSDDDTMSLVDEFPIRALYLDRPYPCNVARAFNVGIKRASHPYLILQAAEVVHRGNAIERLVSVVVNDPKTWAFARVVADPGTREYVGPKRRKPITMLACSTTASVREIGGFNEDFTKKGPEDMEFAQRMIRAGANVVYLANVRGAHQEHSRDRIAGYSTVEDVQEMNEVYRLSMELVERDDVVRNGGNWGRIDDLPGENRS